MVDVSVIMPIYNAEKYVYKAIESIVNQSLEEFELILLDDGSSDMSMKEAGKFADDKRIRFLYNKKNEGIAYSRNRLIKECWGKYIALMDDDDIAPPERLKKEKEYLDKHKEIGVVCGRAADIDEKDNIIRPFSSISYYNPKFLHVMMLFEDPISNGSAMIRKSVIEDNGLKYKDNQYGVEDYRFWAETSNCTSIVSLNDVLLYWRRHNNETKKMREMQSHNRAKAFNNIKKYIIESRGYDLENKELELMYKVLDELDGKYDSLGEMNDFHCILKKIINQTDQEYKKEMIAACKEIFARKTKKASFYWNEYET